MVWLKGTSALLPETRLQVDMRKCRNARKMRTRSYYRPLLRPGGLEYTSPGCTSCRKPPRAYARAVQSISRARIAPVPFWRSGGSVVGFRWDCASFSGGHGHGQVLSGFVFFIYLIVLHRNRYYCAALLLSYYVVPLLSYCVERGLVPRAEGVSVHRRKGLVSLFSIIVICYNSAERYFRLAGSWSYWSTEGCLSGVITTMVSR